MKQKQLGFLSICADKRFWEIQTKKISQKLNLSPAQFWLDARAGGAGKLVQEKNFAAPDHAYHQGARTMVWGMHGDKCGGFPGLTNKQLKKIHQDIIPTVKSRYPKATHYLIWSQETPSQTILTPA